LKPQPLRLRTVL